MRAMLAAVAALGWTACGGGGGGHGSAPPDAAADAGVLADADLDAAARDAAPADAGDAGADAEIDAGPPIATRIWVGVDDIPEDQLGAAPARWHDRPVSFHWTLPPDRWTVEVHADAGQGWMPSAMPYLLWRYVSAAHPPVVIHAEDVDPPGGRWTRTLHGQVWQGQVIHAPGPDAGDYTLQAKVDDLLSDPLPLSVAPLTPDIDPFDQIDDWGLTFDRDPGTLHVGYDHGAYTVTNEATPNGVPDYEEALAAVGLLGGDDAWRQAVLARIRGQVKAHMLEFFHLGPDGAIGEDSVRIRFHFEGDAGEPPADTWTGMGWSRIAIGGDDPTPAGDHTYFGRAALDWDNASVDDDTTPDRGIFTTSFLRFLLGSPVTAVLVADYTPASNGHPFGSLAADQAFLAPDFDPMNVPAGDERVRAARFQLLVDVVSLALAAVTAHEIGHSLGLVKPGPPPTGLLGGVDGPWVVEKLDEDHIDIRGPNLMQSGSSFRLAEILSQPPRFEEVSLAYLRRRLIVMP